MIDIAGLREDKRPQSSRIVHALLDRLEAAERERDALRIELNEIRYGVAVAHDTIKALRAKIETAENDAAHQKALAESALRVAEGWEGKCGELRAALQHEADCVEAAKAEIKALRAKITEMEQQEPVAWLHETRRDSDVVTDAVKHVWGKVAVGSMAAYSIPLYALPGAQTQPAQSMPEVTDAMALAFRHALTDGSTGAREVEDEEIKDALRAALAAAPKLEGR